MERNEVPGRARDSAATGVLVLNKPSGVTSRKLVDQVARLLPRSKVGHAGTLDPLATGILIVCVGPATRLVENVQDLPKTYRTLIRLGARSDTLDADGRIEVEASPTIPSSSEIQQAIRPALGHGEPEATGVFGQEDSGQASLRPGPGRPGPRAGSSSGADRPDRRASTTPGRISSSRSIAAAGPTSDRSPATSAMLSVAAGLSRHWFGPGPARSHSSRPSIRRRSRPSRSMASFGPRSTRLPTLPRLALDAGQVEAIAQGKRLSTRDLRGELNSSAGQVALLDSEGTLIALAEIDLAQGWLQPRKVLV